MYFPLFDYYIAQDSFTIFFPEDEDFDIQLLLEWYKTIPTEPKEIAYYGDNTNLLKEHFNKFVLSGNIKTRRSNDLHAEQCLVVNVMTIYNSTGDLQGFAAQEWINGWGTEKKILYLDELE